MPKGAPDVDLDRPEQDTPGRLREYARKSTPVSSGSHYTGTLAASITASGFRRVRRAR